MGQNFAYTVSSSNELDKKMNDSEGDSNDDSAVRYLQPTPPSSPDTESPCFKESVSPLEILTAASARKEAAILKRKKKKKSPSATSLACNTFHELYTLGEVLGEGAYARVQTCTNLFTGIEYAAKVIDKVPSHSRRRVFREIDLFHRCEGHKNIIKMFEYYEEPDKFYLVFEKVSGGQLFESSTSEPAMKFTCIIALISTRLCLAVVVNGTRKIDINQKVYIENAPVFGDGAGDGLLNTCTRFADQHVSNPDAPAIKVCGTGIKMTIFLRNRCEAYYEHSEEIGSCDKGAAGSTCATMSPAVKPATGHYQSYLIEQC